MTHARMILALAPVLCATEVAALTCSAPDLSRALASIREASELTVVLHGSLMLDEPPPRMEPATRRAWEALVRPGREIPRVIPLGPVRFEGARFGPADIEPLIGDIRIVPSCTGHHYCGSGILEGTYLLFAHEAAKGLAIEVGPCGPFAFTEPDPALLDVVAACVVDDVCPP